MFKWLENFVIKRIVKRVTAELPELKEKAGQYWESHKDEIIEKIEGKIKDVILDIIKK